MYCITEIDVIFVRGGVMKRGFSFLLVLLLGSVMLFSISLSEAENIALDDAGVKADSVSNIRTHSSKDDGRNVYDVEFISGDYRFDYEIDRESGDILSMERSQAPARPAAPKGRLTGDEALMIALNDAKLSNSDVSRVSVEQDRDDGKSVYDIDFRAGDVSYDYQILIESGEIISADWEKRGQRQDRSQPVIGVDKAEKIALAMVPEATSDDIRVWEERDDGRRTYEGKIRLDGVIYDFEMDAVSGDMLSFSREIW